MAEFLSQKNRLCPLDAVAQTIAAKQLIVLCPQGKARLAEIEETLLPGKSERRWGELLGVVFRYRLQKPLSLAQRLAIPVAERHRPTITAQDAGKTD